MNLFAIGFYPPRNLTGAEKSGWIAAKQLAKKGHKLTIFTEELIGVNPPKEPNIKVIKVKTERTLDVNPNDYALAKPIWQISALGGVYFRPFIDALRKEMEGQKPDAILVNWGVPFTSFVLPITRETGIPVITVLHGSDVHALTQRDFSEVKNPVVDSYKNSDARIAVADYLKVILNDMGITDVETIRNAIDRKEFSPISPLQVARERVSLRIQRNTTVFVHVSNLRPVKDPLKIVEAAEIALKKNSNLHFLIVGDGPLRLEMKKTTRKKHIGDKFTFTGKVSACGVRKYLSVSHAHVMSSVREGTPLVILEAFAAGKPTIASRVGGIPEILNHNYNGFLYEQGNIHEFSEQMLRMTDPETRRRLSRGARQSSREHSLEKLGRSYESIIRGAIKRKQQCYKTENPSLRKLEICKDRNLNDWKYTYEFYQKRGHPAA